MVLLVSFAKANQPSGHKSITERMHISFHCGSPIPISILADGGLLKRPLNNPGVSRTPTQIAIARWWLQLPWTPLTSVCFCLLRILVPGCLCKLQIPRKQSTGGCSKSRFYPRSWAPDPRFMIFYGYLVNT